jgi:hypothetical protein
MVSSRVSLFWPAWVVQGTSRARLSSWTVESSAMYVWTQGEADEKKVAHTRHRHKGYECACATASAS